MVVVFSKENIVKVMNVSFYHQCFSILEAGIAPVMTSAYSLSLVADAAVFGD